MLSNRDHAPSCANNATASYSQASYHHPRQSRIPIACFHGWAQSNVLERATSTFVSRTRTRFDLECNSRVTQQ
jgi:hypothetical protein